MLTVYYQDFRTGEDVQKEFELTPRIGIYGEVKMTASKDGREPPG